MTNGLTQFAPGGSEQSQRPYPGAKDVATVLIEHLQFSDWETVWIRDTVGQVYPEFHFTCAERDKLSPLWSQLQIRPRYTCTIYLNNVRAVSGVVLVRQAAFDANNHGVSIQGVGVSWYAARASIIPSQAVPIEGGIVEVAQKLLAPTGIKVLPIGNIDPTPFKPPVQPTPGETMFAFLEKLGRNRKVIMGSDTDGTWLIIGQNVPPSFGDVIEGINILGAQVLIDDRGARSTWYVGGQKQGSDQDYMTKASEMQAKVDGDLPRYSPLYIPIEHPVWTQHEVQLRAELEAMWDKGEEITATITVPGWFNPRTGNLWKARTLVTVQSPMAMLNGYPMTARSVTFMQDRQQGSRTVLDLVSPWRILQDGYITSSSVQPPGNATSEAAPNQVPPTPQVEIGDVEILPPSQ
jgi:prophage tail gpP-like protein